MSTVNRYISAEYNISFIILNVFIMYYSFNVQITIEMLQTRSIHIEWCIESSDLKIR